MNEQKNKPLPNSYWVRPNQLLAGEYPLVLDEQQSVIRLQDLLSAGVTSFIDLTDQHELTSYMDRLPDTFSGKSIQYQRFALIDHGVPESMQRMTIILDAIDAAIAAGHCVYVHCRAGIGRTGTVIGCHLVRHGHHGVEAIEALNMLWLDSERSKQWVHVPETEEQELFILEFKEEYVVQSLPTHQDSRLSQYQGAILGLMLGDVYGGLSLASTDQVSVGNLATSSWSGNAAMSWAMADSLVHCREQRPLDQMQRYQACHKQGKYTAHSELDILAELVQKSIGLWLWKRNPLAGSHDPRIIDAHPLVRSVPVVLFFASRPQVAIEQAAESARTTSQAPIVLDACRVFAALLLSIMEGVPIAHLLQFNTGSAAAALRAIKLKPELEQLINGGWRTAITSPAGTDCVSVLASACYALATTTDFHGALSKSVAHATQPAVVGGVCGALAGVLYGLQGLPIVWRETLPKAKDFLVLGERLLLAAPSA